MSNATISIFVVDDQALVRTGLTRILSPAEGFDVLAECGDGAEALAALDRARPDVILMDVRMRGMGGIEATTIIRDRNGPPVLILTTFDDDDVLAGALAAGAAGFLLKESPAEDLIRATQVVAAGGAWLDPIVTPRVLDSYRRRADRGLTEAHGAKPLIDYRLTARENDVLRLMAVGATNAEIAEDLKVGDATVKTHIGHIFAKLGARDRAAAIIFAYDHGLVEPDPPVV